MASKELTISGIKVADRNGQPPFIISDPKTAIINKKGHR